MKKYRFFSVLVIAVLLVFYNGCSPFHTDGNGRVVSREVSVNEFTGVILDGAGNVNIHYSEICRVIVITDSNIQDIIVIKLNDDFVHIDEKSCGGINPTKLSIDVYLPELSYVNLKGAGNIKIADGKAHDIKLVLSGYGNIDARNFEADNVEVVLSGVGDIKAWATMSLTGKLSGVGNIIYKGNPPVNSISKTGVGDIKKY